MRETLYNFSIAQDAGRMSSSNLNALGVMMSAPDESLSIEVAKELDPALASVMLR